MSELMIHRINTAWESGDASAETRRAVAETLDRLNVGEIRVAESRNGQWIVNEWIKRAILLHFRLTSSVRMSAGPLEWFDKVPLKCGFAELGVRCNPIAVVRRGAYLEPGVVLMPSYVNIGARVGAGTMIDTWSTIGACAQVGARCHISGGVGIGGVLEPPQARPVIIEDDVFIGARSEVAEGVIVEREAVLAMGCYVGASTKVWDTERDTVIEPGRIPARAVCVPGSLPSRDGSHSTYALIIKKRRDARTDARTELNALLRD
jgi:2,3,4,5-tetrahydropyridine-2,6-dicarboxylate N-succinyltransferase